MKTKRPDDGLRKLNNLLTIVIICLGMYLIISPLLPQANYWLRHITGRTGTIPYVNSLNISGNQKPIPKENRLVIPQIDLNAEVFDGPYASTLSKGIWHRPKTSTPDQGSNTVLVAHRFTYRSPAIFYNLDKMKKDDTFVLYWGGKEYDYKVREIKTVQPTDTYIEEPTPEPILTLYTCTPLWTSKERLVIIADLIKEPSR